MKIHLTIKLILLLLLFKSAGAQFSSEFSASGERTELGLDLFYYIDKQKRWSIYSHNLLAYHHNDKKTGFLTFNKLSYTFNSGIGFSANFIETNNGFYPSAGLHFDKKIDHIRIFILTTYAFDNNRSNENFLIVSYKYPITEKFKLLLQNEYYASLRKLSNNHSMKKMKIGLEFHKTQTGIFTQSSHDDIKFNLKTSSFGWYLRQNF